MRGRTVSNEGNSPIFDEPFEFLINLPEMALLRFVVLDDEFIGDDFIGQYSIPFECLQTGESVQEGRFRGDCTGGGLGQETVSGWRC